MNQATIFLTFGGKNAQPLLLQGTSEHFRVPTVSALERFHCIIEIRSYVQQCRISHYILIVISKINEENNR